MKKSLCGFLLVTAFSFLIGSSAEAAASSFTIDLEFQMSGDLTDEIETAAIESEGWKLESQNGEDTYRLKKIIKLSDLPFGTSIGSASFTISKTGMIEMGMSVGDADGSTEGRLQWPTEKKKLVQLATPLAFEVSGGEHASGAWQFEGKATITLQ